MPIKGSCICPECGKDNAPRWLNKHTSECELWLAKHHQPWPKFKFSAKREWYTPDQVEGVDFVRCQLCFEHGWDFRFRVMKVHVTKVHGLSERDYQARFPGATLLVADANERRKRTALDRYGVDHVAKLPESKAKSIETTTHRYGVANVFQSPEVKARAAKTNLERYGAENPFASPQIKEKIKESMLEKYGVTHPAHCGESQERRKTTTREVYGVDYFMQSEEFKAKSEATCIERYGLKSATSLEETKAKTRATMMDRYGVTCPAYLPSKKGPNVPEALVQGMVPQAIYTGNSDWWRFLPALGTAKNPDFLIPGPDPDHPRRGVTKVVEVFGDYWHSEKVTGIPNQDHEDRIVSAYAEIGIQCLVLWEGDIKRDQSKVEKLLSDFLAR